MAQHEVDFTVLERPLGRADVEFNVKQDSIAVGRIKFSNGTVVWVPRNKTYGFRVNWADFDKLMQENGMGEV